MNDFWTCDLCDEHQQDPRLRVLPPVFMNYGARRSFSGPAVTIKCFEDNSLVVAALESPGDRRVLVVDAGSSLRRAMFGGQMAAAAVRNGWAGVLVDGAVRDVAELRDNDIGILALAPMPLATDRRNVGTRDVPVRIQGVLIEPGEWIYADEDGIVILPAPA